MKYIKTYERTFLNKKTVDYNKVYTIVFSDNVYMIGKMIPNPGKGFRDVGCLLIGYNNKTGEEEAQLIKYGSWQWIREATPKEIEKYYLLANSNKYNL